MPRAWPSWKSWVSGNGAICRTWPRSTGRNAAISIWANAFELGRLDIWVDRRARLKSGWRMTNTNPVLGGGGFHHVAIKTREWDRTMKFYQELLGFRVKMAWNAAPKRAVMLDGGDGNYLEVFEDLAFTPGPATTIVH